MNQENKFGEYWKRFIEYLRIFFSACASAVKSAWGFLRRSARAVLQQLAFLALAAREWVQALISRIRERLPMQTARKEPVREEYAYTIAEEGAAEEVTREAESAEEPADDRAQPEEAAEEAPEAEEETEDEKSGEEKKKEKPPVKFDDPNWQKAYEIFWYTCRGLKFTMKWAWKLRSVFMAIPVIWAAIKLAMQNMERLPEQVGLDIQSTGEFARMISREDAVYWPLGITAFCLVLMFCSKKPMLPWVISIFTLILPWLIWILNYYA